MFKTPLYQYAIFADNTICRDAPKKKQKQRTRMTVSIRDPDKDHFQDQKLLSIEGC